MQIVKIVSKHGYANSYIVSADGRDGILIDCASPEVYNICNESGIKIHTVFLTHGHFDHVGGCGKLYAAGVDIVCGNNEKDLILSRDYLNIFGGVYVPEFKISYTVTDGVQHKICGLDIKVLDTPGHSAGSVCYIIGNTIFTGDTLFCGSIGRTDLPTGNINVLRGSLKKLCDLDSDYELCCGHGENSLLSRERKFNPYLRNI